MSSGKSYPTFTPDMDTRGMSAAEMQNMSDASKRADGFTAGPGANIRHGPNGKVISVDPVRSSHILSHTRFVAVVVPPTPLDTHVLVRDVVYAIEEPEPIAGDDAPQAGEYTYRWGSTSRIRALPGIGYRPLDFADGVYADLDESENEIAPIASTPIYWLELRGQGPPLLWPMGGGGTQSRPFKITVINYQWMLAHTWDESTETEGDVGIAIARPWTLRNRTFEVRFFHHSPAGRAQERRVIATEGNPDFPQLTNELQVIVPRYHEGDIIYATKVAPGFAMMDFWDFPPSDMTWIDDNRDGRAWAKEYGY